MIAGILVSGEAKPLGSWSGIEGRGLVTPIVEDRTVLSVGDRRVICFLVIGKLVRRIEAGAGRTLFWLRAGGASFSLDSAAAGAEGVAVLLRPTGKLSL